MLWEPAVNRPLSVLVLAGTLTLAACVRDRPVYDRTEESIRVQTIAAVRASAPGADVRVNGTPVGTTPDDGSPLRVKLIYRYQDNVFLREKSYLLYRESVESRVKEWLNNTFEISVTKPGYHPASTTVVLRGEHEYEVPITLRARDGLAVPDETDGAPADAPADTGAGG